MLATPRFVLRLKERRLMAAFERRSDKDEIMRRVDYYNRLAPSSALSASLCRPLSAHTWRLHKGPSVYFFDTFEFLRYFPKHFCWAHEPGDVRALFETPTIVKTRPLVHADSRFANSVLLNLDKVRHFFLSTTRFHLPANAPRCCFAATSTTSPTAYGL